MKFSLTFILTALISSSIAQSACPDGIKVRHNYLSMDQSERNKFHLAVNQLNIRGWGAYFAKLHTDYFSQVHSNSQYFAWHRKFIREFEKAIQEIDPAITLPYWDSTEYSNDPAKSPVFNSINMGSNGSGSDNCVATGAFASLQLTYPNRHCLQRKFNNGETIRPWYGSAHLQNVLSTSSSYENLRQNIEYSIDGAVHQGIGGDMATSYAPNDPLSWIHDSFIDYIWWKWQKSDPSHATDFPANPQTTILAGFDVPVSSTFDTQGSGYCYTYSD